MSERLNVKIASLYVYHGGKEMKELRWRVMNIVNEYLTNNRIRKALRQLEYLGDDHRYLKSNGIDMNVLNHYRTPNYDIIWKRNTEYHGLCRGRARKNFNINRISYFKDIPDGIEILVDYVDVTAIRTMNIPTEIIYESIYRELPELFEE